MSRSTTVVIALLLKAQIFKSFGHFGIIASYIPLTIRAIEDYCRKAKLRHTITFLGMILLILSRKWDIQFMV